MAFQLRTLIVLALAASATAHPNNMADSCGRDLRGSAKIMGATPVSDPARMIKISTVACGGELVTGTEYAIEVSGMPSGAEYLIKFAGTATGVFAKPATSNGKTCGMLAVGSTSKVTFSKKGTAVFETASATSRGVVSYGKQCSYTVTGEEVEPAATTTTAAASRGAFSGVLASLALACLAWASSRH